MRLRNVKGASELIENCDYVVKNYNEYKGSFNKLFNNKNSLHIEIGMGKGDFIIEMAKRNPNINFIGIEKYDSVIVRAIEKLNDIYLPNLKLMRMDANVIDSVFNKEVDVIYLNFSDPWPKARHSNRRLSSTNFLKKYDNIFKSDMKIIMKTDNTDLFEFSLIEFVNYGYKIEYISLDLSAEQDVDNVMTEYEKKFSSKGYKIYKVVVKK